MVIVVHAVAKLKKITLALQMTIKCLNAYQNVVMVTFLKARNAMMEIKMVMMVALPLVLLKKDILVTEDMTHTLILAHSLVEQNI